MTYQPPLDYYKTRQVTRNRGLGAGITSIVCAVMSPVPAVVSIPLGIAAMASQLGNYGGDNQSWWIGTVLLAAASGALSVGAIVAGLIAVVRAGRMNAGRITGIIGLALMAVNIFVVAFLVFLVLGALGGA
ncbi:hypothetical protein ACPFL9_17790 [Paenarthrobacter sp. NyZ202]|uniref:hypothetical protein n=1 Tax=Paenarthrobacter sp. NyZ202 TaxID=3402689 RepID=UPI003CF22944